MILSDAVLTSKENGFVKFKDAKAGEYLCYDPTTKSLVFSGLGKVSMDGGSYIVYRIKTEKGREVCLSQNSKVMAKHQNIETMLSPKDLSGNMSGQSVFLKFVIPKGSDYIFELDKVVSVRQDVITEGRGKKAVEKERNEAPFTSQCMLMRLLVVDGVLVK